MTMDAVLIGIVGVILGGGGIGALIPLLRFRADRDTAVATGAEIAVQSLTVALKRSDDRVTHLEEENDKLRAIISELRLDVTTAQIAVRNITNDLAETKAKLDRLVRHEAKGDSNDK